MTHFEARGAVPGPEAIVILAVGLAEPLGEALAALLRPFEFRLRSAADPEIAWSAMQSQRPRLLVVDADMPGALALLRSSAADLQLPSVLLCRPDFDRKLLVQLLDTGVLDALSTLTLSRAPSHEVAEARGIFLDALRDASMARLPVCPLAAAEQSSLSPELFDAPRVVRRGHELPTLVAVASATGGVDALRIVLARLPENTPGIVVAHHGSPAFVEAARAVLASATRLRVRVARHGDRVEPGLALLAPGDRHMRTVRRGTGYRVSVSDGPLVARRRPSADVLLRSVSEAAGSAAIGVILSGVGQDGADGAAALKRSLGSVLAQDEATSVAFGMPAAAIARGVIDVVAAPMHLPALLAHYAVGPRGRA